MSIDPFVVATDGLGGNNPTLVATMGFGPFVTVTVLDPPAWEPRPRAGHNVFQGAAKRHEKTRGETILVRYKGKMVEYNRERDKHRKLVHISVRLPNERIKTHLMLIDAEKVPIVVRASNLVNRAHRAIVKLFALRRREKGPEVHVKVNETK